MGEYMIKSKAKWWKRTLASFTLHDAYRSFAPRTR